MLTLFHSRLLPRFVFPALLFILTLIGVPSQTAGAQNLIVNSGAEADGNDTAADPVPENWTEDPDLLPDGTENDWGVGDFNLFLPPNGQNAFVPTGAAITGGAPFNLQQDITGSQVTGGAKYEFSGMYATSTTSLDEVRVLLEFRDGNGTVLDTYDTGRMNTGGVFIPFSTTQTAPSGTSVIRVRMQGFELDNSPFTEVAFDALDLRATNLPPEVATNAGSSVDEGTNDTITRSELETTDPEQSASQLTYTIDTDVSEGQLVNTNASTQLDQGDTFTQADINNGDIQYQHDGTEPVSDVHFDFTVSDGQGGSTSGTFSFTINPVNDAPTISTISAHTIEEDATLSSVAFTVDDTETSDLSTLSLSGSSSNTTLVPNSNITFTGPDNSGNASITVNPAPNESGTATITVTVDDGATSNNTASTNFTLTVTAVPDLTITDGSAAGLDFTSDVSPGTNDNPVGIFALSAGQNGASFDEVTVTINPSGVSGISAARLYWSTDQSLDTGTSGDDQLGSDVSVDPSSAPGTITFSGFNQSIPTSPRYAIIAIDVQSGASADVQFELADESDLSVPGGEIATVNGSSQSSFAGLRLSNGSTALPVEMASFEASTRGEDGAVKLRWQTASESNNAGFEVQRGGTGDAWTSIGSVEGAGTTTTSQSYTFTDTDVPYQADSLTYRLKQVDVDGNISYSRAITVARSAVAEVRLLGTYPNPARSQVTTRFALPEGASSQGVRLHLYDVMGRQVRTVPVEASPGRHKAQLDVAGLSTGVYFLRLQTGSTVKTQRLTVVR